MTDLRKTVWLKILIALGLLWLPVTSFPLLSRALGGTMVAPPSTFLLALLGGIIVLYDVWRGTRWPFEAAFLLIFVGVALFSTAWGLFRPLPPLKLHSYRMEALQTVFTLGLGVAVWLAAALIPREKETLQFWLRWINLAGLLLVAWGGAQAAIIFFRDSQYPNWMVSLHHWFTGRDLLRWTFRKRVTAWAYEPSWLAHMLNVLFFPYWLGATLTGYSAFPRWKKLSLENFLLAGGFLVLLTSFSRIGLLAFFLMLAVLLTAAVWRGAEKLFGGHRWKQVLALLVAWLALIGVALGLLWVLSLRDPRLAGVFAIRHVESVYDLARQLKVAERLIYWALALQVFAAHPVLGVGLGGVGFFSLQYLPAYAWHLPEVVAGMVLRDYVFNAKNLWVRLLAETGLLGWSAFLVFLLVLALDAWFLLQQSDRMARTLGWMGLLGIVALLGEGFSLDTFAFPYYWLTLGLLTAAVWRLRQEEMV